MQNIDFNRKQKVHFIGIGGINMSAIAQELLFRGFAVSGSDGHASDITRELELKGAEIFIGQSADNIAEDVDMVVYTAAIAEENPELRKARSMAIPCLSRAEFLGELMKDYEQRICVSGTHGKTTTTSMLSEILLDAETDPTIMVGGIMPRIGGNVRIGASGNFLTEACEYTNSFLSFFPTIAVILNVQEDHMDFFRDLADIRSSFRRFAQLVPKDGTLVINGEIDHAEYFIQDCPGSTVTFGLDEDCDYHAADIAFNDFACPSFTLYVRGENTGRVELKVPGRHNIYNALAALAAAEAAGLDLSRAIGSVMNFQGVDRRFQYKGMLGGVTVVDDYAHHPDEIRATLDAAIRVPHKKLWVVFQPHTYSRTEAFMQEFAQELSRADAVILAEIYAAREQNIHGISSRDLMQQIRDLGTECYYFPTFSEIENFLLEKCEEGDMFITMGAGDVVTIGDFLLGN